MKLANFKEYLRQLNWLIVCITLLVFFGLIKLGLWQSARALEKELRLAKIANYQTQQAMTLAQLEQLSASERDINDIPVMISGTFDDQHIFLLDNQTNNGRLGYRVLQVLETNEGRVLVNLGWIQGYIERDKLPKVEAITGFHQLTGNVRLVEAGIVLAEQSYQNAQWPLRIQQIELDKFSQLIAQKLLPFVVYLDTKEPLGYEKNWRPIVMPPEKHRAYAFQWFSLASAWLVLMFSASIWFYKNKNQ